MTNFLSFDVYNIDLSKIMNDSNLNFILLQQNWNLPNRAIKSVITSLQTDDDWKGVRKITLRLENNNTPNTYFF
jgi:hypothetical protein